MERNVGFESKRAADSVDPGRLKMESRSHPRDLRRRLDRLATSLQKEEFLQNDPVVFLHRCEPSDAEIVGLIASSLAYGNIKMILSSVGRALDRLGPSPAERIRSSSPKEIKRALTGFRHRFTSGEDLAELLTNAGRIIHEHGSLGAFFASVDDTHTATIESGSILFVKKIRGKKAGKGLRYLVPSPSDGSACKRLMMFLRWMVRGPDGCDLGLWRRLVSPARLVIPLDTHTARIGRMIGLSDRKTADWRMALEVTSSLRTLDPNDPIRYDFSLSHLGIERFCRAGGLKSASHCGACPLNRLCVQK